MRPWMSEIPNPADEHVVDVLCSLLRKDGVPAIPQINSSGVWRIGVENGELRTEFFDNDTVVEFTWVRYVPTFGTVLDLPGRPAPRWRWGDQIFSPTQEVVQESPVLPTEVVQEFDEAQRLVGLGLQIDWSKSNEDVLAPYIAAAEEASASKPEQPCVISILDGRRMIRLRDKNTA